MKENFLVKLLAIMVLLYAAACGSGDTSTEQSSSEEFDAAQEDLKEQLSNIIEEIPKPSDIPYVLESTGADYNASLINDIAKVDNYKTTNRLAALNLGVYGADIAYLSSYGKSQEALEYLETSKELADYLNISGSFERGVFERFESNLSERDSLANIVNEVISDANDYLQNDERNRVGALIVTGSFIEGLYVSTGVVRTYPKDLLPEDSRNLILTPLMRLILDQEQPLGDVIELLESVNTDNSEDQLIADLTELKSIYEALSIEEAISNQEAAMALSDENLIGITEKVNEIRSGIAN